MSAHELDFIRRPRDRIRIIDEYVQPEEPNLVIIRVAGRFVKIFGINKKKMKEEFKAGLGKFMEPVISLRDLTLTWNNYVAQNRVSTEFCNRGKEVFRKIQAEYTPFTLVKAAIPEELYKEVFKKTPRTWKIPKKYVPVVRQQFPGFDGPEEGQLLLKDYYYAQNEVPFMHGVPRVELLRSAIRSYLNALEINAEDIEEEDEILLCPIDEIVSQLEEKAELAKEGIVVKERFPFNVRHIAEAAKENLARVCTLTGLQVVL